MGQVDKKATSAANHEADEAHKAAKKSNSRDCEEDVIIQGLRLPCVKPIIHAEEFVSMMKPRCHQ